MSKTFMYLLATIAAFLVFVKGLSDIGGDNVSDKTDSDSGTLENGIDENNVSKDTTGQHRYRIGVPYNDKVQQESYNNKQDDLKDKIKSDISYTM